VAELIHRISPAELQAGLSRFIRALLEYYILVPWPGGGKHYARRLSAGRARRAALLEGKQAELERTLTARMMAAARRAV